MKEILELNKRILTEAPDAVPKEFGSFLITRASDVSAECAALPASIRGDLAEFLGKLNDALPDDFGYQISLGDSNPALMITYADGADTEGNCPIEWSEGRSIIDQLENVDWDKNRKQILQFAQIFDEMKEFAKHAEPGLPSTKKLQKQFRGEMKEFVKSKRKDTSKIHVLMWRDDEQIVKESFDTMESFCQQLPDLMTVQYLVISVVADGRPLPVERIEKLKKEALKELEGMPISHARALGKF